jgi:hypothetical protein
MPAGQTLGVIEPSVAASPKVFVELKLPMKEGVEKRGIGDT